MRIKFEKLNAAKGAWWLGILTGFCEPEDLFVIQFNLFKWTFIIKIFKGV